MSFFFANVCELSVLLCPYFVVQVFRVRDVQVVAQKGIDVTDRIGFEGAVRPVYKFFISAVLTPTIWSIFAAMPTM